MIAALSEMRGAVCLAARRPVPSRIVRSDLRYRYRNLSSTLRNSDESVTEREPPTSRDVSDTSEQHSVDQSSARDRDTASPSNVTQDDDNTTIYQAQSGPSRDMTLDAESSRGSRAPSASPDHAASPNDPGREDPNEAEGIAEEDRQFAEIFNTLRKEWPKPLSSSSPSPPSASTFAASDATRPIRAKPIGPQLTFDAWDTPSPRSTNSRGQKGVHARNRRAAGQTPQEAAAFNRILADIFADLEAGSGSRSNTNSGSNGVAPTAGVHDAYAATRGGLGSSSTFGLSKQGVSPAAGAKARAQGLRRMFEREEDEADDQMIEELDMLKEEMEVIGTDVELLEWAKRRVFKPMPATGNAGSDTTSIVGYGGLTYPRSYPRILSHLLKTLRINYNSPHLVLSLFDYAKNISFESYLSGCLSGAYNEVLTVKWESFRDLEGVELGLKEMENMGVRWDLGTVRLVGKIVEEVGKQVLAQSQQGTEEGGRWGKDVFDRLARLDERVNKDVKEQEWYYEQSKLERRRQREEKERKAEREMRADHDQALFA